MLRLVLVGYVIIPLAWSTLCCRVPGTQCRNCFIKYKVLLYKAWHFSPKIFQRLFSRLLGLSKLVLEAFLGQRDHCKCNLMDYKI